ncbi:hypothetical protein H7B90_13935 [Cohnella xylanilytica]|uniref:Uncharacterized protein n=1 Tax=Cohnella xylanilytica TaxID=557555 RepID=A0A841TWE9_9BACL|nr:hypothetical protein [Cohnella xylanilytica]MBB6692505.1 hypothetical protein [Cohnella xylanilytica]
MLIDQWIGWIGDFGYAVYSGGLRVLWLAVAIGGAAWILYSRREKGRSGG